MHSSTHAHDCACARNGSSFNIVVVDLRLFVFLIAVIMVMKIGYSVLEYRGNRSSLPLKQKASKVCAQLGSESQRRESYTALSAAATEPIRSQPNLKHA